MRSTMKLLKTIPRKLFKSKKSRSDTPSFGSGTSSDLSEFKKETGSSTPTSVLPPNEIDWLEKYDAVDVNDFVQAFKVMDHDGDGKIKREELLGLLSRVGGAEPVTEDEIRLMLSEVDRDGDGCISLEELSFIGGGGAPACGDELRGAFDFFDTDHNGKITAEELCNGFRTIGDARCTLEDCRRMITEVDTNGDGFVCFEDFSRMMEQQQQLLP